MRRILSDIRGLLLVALALLAGAPSLLALAPVAPLVLPHPSSAVGGAGLAPFPLPASRLPGDEAEALQSHEVLSPRDSLLNVAEKYAGATYIPYVWGGSAVGSETACNECRACISLRHHVSVGKQRSSCAACKQCGMDCSHFVQRVFKEAGLDFPYLPTVKLKNYTRAKLQQSNLVDIGHNLDLAKPGDLLLHRHHIVLLLDKAGRRTGDFIHVSRSFKHGHVGGVEVVRNADLEKYRGKVLKILRHVAIDQADKHPPAPKQLKLKPLPKAYDLSTLRIVRAE